MEAPELIVVDGANAFNSVGRILERCLPDDDRARVPSYLETWFDFDRFLFASTGVALNTPIKLGIVMFCGEQALGRSPYRVTNHLQFWMRQGATRGCSILRPSVPSGGREKYTFKCKNCDAENEVEKKGEKGVDVAIASYLFETVGNWNAAYLVARDADYVPTVQSLRRRGKRFFVVVESRDTHTSLVQSAQSHWLYDEGFLERDFLYFKLFGKDGEFVSETRGVPFPSFGENNSVYGGLDLHLATDNRERARQLLVEKTGLNDIGREHVIHVSDDSMIEGIVRNSPMPIKEKPDTLYESYDE